MSSVRRELVRTIVFEAFDRFEDDAEGRQAYLRERCRDNPEYLPIAMEEVEVEERIRKGQFMDKPAAALLGGVIPEGTLIGEYRIGSLIGEGAMGAVYRARQTSLDRDVAVKTLRTPLGMQAGQRFLSEAKTLSRIASERVIHVYAYGDYHGQPYIVMEYGEGTNLAQMIADQKFPDVKSRLAIALQIAEGLEQIHHANIAHRDVKSSNVLVDGEGNVKLIDFGIAWREDSRMTQIGQALGTPAYMPPEQILRHLGGSATDVEQYKRVDIYSFGILLYELFTGELPLKGETRGEVEREIVHTPVALEPLRNCHVPAGVIELIRLASSKNPAARPRNFTEVANLLRASIEEFPAREAARVKPSLRTPITVICILAILIGLAAVYSFRNHTTVHSAGSVPSISPALKADLKGLPETRPAIPHRTVAVNSMPVAPPRNFGPISSKIPEETAPAQPTPKSVPEPKQTEDPAIPPPLPAPLPAPVPAPELAASAADVLHDRAPDVPAVVESAEERDWVRLRDTRDAAALQAFWTAYPNGKHAAEARRAAAAIEYQGIKNSNSPEALQNFAQKYPEHPFAASALSIANQFQARMAASTEIRETLKRYATAMHGMKLSDVLATRELDKQQQSKIENLFHTSRRIEMALALTTPPQFAEPVVEDPSGKNQIPMHATAEGDLDMLVVSGSGDAQSEKRRVTVHLKRTAKGWVITSF